MHSSWQAAFTQKNSDPLGKYIGSILYIAIGLTLLSPTAIVFTIVEVGFPAFAIASLVTRITSFTTIIEEKHQRTHT